MEITTINFFGALIGVIVAKAFYGTFWIHKETTTLLTVCGVFIIAVINIIFTILFLNTALLLTVSVLLMFALSFFYISKITSKILLAIIITAVLLIVEQLVGMFMINVLGIPLTQVQQFVLPYMFGVIVARLLVLFLVYIARIVMKGHKHEADNQFNILMAIMPLQSILICFIVFGYSMIVGTLETSLLGIVAIVVALALVLITMIILQKQQKNIAHNRENELMQFMLKTQVDHYRKLNDAHHDMRTVRHDISNNLLAISGMLEKGFVPDAVERINEINNNVSKSANIIDTGLPAIDAILNSKITMAVDHCINIKYEVILNAELTIDQFEVALLLANALDNAIEGILRSSAVERDIRLDFVSGSDYVSILVENHSSGPINEGFRTSKSQKANHGYGLRQMKAIAEKYNGDLHPSYNSETGMFKLEVLLKNKPA